jgi:hypothetical protein
MFKSILLYSLLPLLALAQETATATQSAPTSQHTTNTGYNGGEDNPQDPSDAGAAGSSNGAFALSKGGLAAIIIVAVLVAVGGSKSINASTRSLFSILIAHQLHLPFSSGLQRSVSGTSVNLFAVHLGASLAAPMSIRPTNARTDELVCDSILLLHRSLPGHDRTKTWRRVYHQARRMEERRRQSQAHLTSTLPLKRAGSPRCLEARNRYRMNWITPHNLSFFWGAVHTACKSKTSRLDSGNRSRRSSRTPRHYGSHRIPPLFDAIH